MDVDEPLRKLLETTGWSCDDLLEKILKFKSGQKRSSNLNSQKPVNDIQQANGAAKCVEDSREDIYKERPTSKTQEPNEGDVRYPRPVRKNKNVEFSDTDEDEAAVLVTNSNIIDEIIEDIFSSDSTENSKSPTTEKRLPQITPQTTSASPETSEVTEVKVIELHEEDDDDKFEDECHEVDRLTPEKIEELEKLSRELTYTDDVLEEMETAMKIKCFNKEIERKFSDKSCNLLRRTFNDMSEINLSSSSNLDSKNEETVIEVRSDSEETVTRETANQLTKNRHRIEINIENNITHESSETLKNSQENSLETEHIFNGNVENQYENKVDDTEPIAYSQKSNGRSHFFKNTLQYSDGTIPENGIKNQGKICTNTEVTETPGNTLVTKAKTELPKTDESGVFNSSTTTENEDTHVPNRKGKQIEHEYNFSMTSATNVTPTNFIYSDEPDLPTRIVTKSKPFLINSQDKSAEEKENKSENCGTSTETNTDISSSHNDENNSNKTSNPLDAKILKGLSNCIMISQSETDMEISKHNESSQEALSSERTLTSETPSAYRSEYNSDESESLPMISCLKTFHEDFETGVDEDTPRIFDDIRNNLRMQLSCLRTKKKGIFLGDISSVRATNEELPDDLISSSALVTSSRKLKIVDIEKNERSDLGPKIERETFNRNNTAELVIENLDSNLERNGDRNNESYPQISSEEDNVHIKCSQNSDIIQIKNDNNGNECGDTGEDQELYTQTNELGLVISNVQGGIKIDQSDNERFDKTEIPQAEFNGEQRANPSIEDENFDFTLSNEQDFTGKKDTSGVFEEIRKIIRKQKPEASVPKPSISSYKKLKNGLSDDKTMETVNSFVSSADNSQSSFYLEDSFQNTENYSPFISNSLDEFLTENSKLNISYNVPKCGAEEGLKDSYEETTLLLKKNVKMKVKDEKLPKKLEKIKAKTLAQKRKLLERQRQREWKKREKFNAETANNIKDEKRCFIMFRDEKIWVETNRASGNCIAVIESLNQYKQKKETSPIRSKRKFSLLADSKPNKIKYLPGPLSKKPLLQLTGNANWETMTKKLPKLFLEILPGIGKPLPPNIIRYLPDNDGSLTEEQIKFALSVVKNKKNENITTEKFVFPVKYWNNQEQVVVRKRKSSSSLLLPNADFCQTTDFSLKAVKDVIEGLINYIEITELSTKLIKEEDLILENDIDLKPSNSSLNENISSIRKPPKKKTRIDIELQRLNCKVVNVELEKQEDNDLCTKAFCKLGCVCKSLKCDTILSLHCQKYHCMFNCTCPKEKSMSDDHNLILPSGTNILSTEAVNRIEDEAKKHLAKVERDFTQTVIQTNDKTIVVGLGTRYKSRRNTKTPIKYSDFVDDEYLLENIQEKNVSKTTNLRNCKVHLMKLKLSEIVPYCLVHELHNCHCRGKANYINDKKYLDKLHYAEKSTNKNTFVGTICKKQKKSKSDTFNSKRVLNIDLPLPNLNQEVPTVPRYSVSDSSQIKMDSSPEINNLNGRPIRTIKKPNKLDENFEYSYTDTVICPDSVNCARVRGIDSNFRKRNRIDETSVKNDFIHNIREADVLKYKQLSTLNQFETVEADVLKWHLIRDSLNLRRTERKKTNRKRKQIIEVRDENVNSFTANYFYIDGAMQRRKKVVTAVKTNRDIRPVFDGEIVISETNMELLTRMGPRHVADGYARLLPWTNLVKSFKDEKINIWCMKDQTTKLMMNKAECNNPPKNYVDIKDTKDKTMIISCILENKLPPGYDHDNVSFILKESKDNYEICGLCAKNMNGKCSKVPLVVSRTQFPEYTETSFVHRSMNGIQRTLFMRKEKFKLQELIEHDLKDVGENSIESTKLYMWASLPEIYRVCKWRVVYLNSDFTYLFFKKINYSIKYTDLLSVGMTAKENSLTVMLRNIEMQKHYDHKIFGIYFDPHYQDRLFVGPYFKTYNENDIETMRYINGKLVCTESFNRMRGEGDYKCGHWLIERPYKSNAAPTIDLTEDKEEDICPSSNNAGHIFIYNDQEVQIIDTVPKSPAEFNRYIITNIPHFGYLGAYQHHNSEIDIQWPFEKKLLRFRDTKNAIDFLQKRFSSLLVSVPQTFKIVVLLLTSIDFQNTLPIRSNVLNGYHICGDFGFHSISDLTEENCGKKTGFSKDQIIRSFLMKRHNILKDRARQLASLLEISEDTSNIHNIVTRATAIIKKLHETNRQLVNEKSELLLEKRSKATKAFELISQLTPVQKYVESKKLMSILNCTEPIEVIDSDDEKERKSSRVHVPSSLSSASSVKQQSLLKPLIRVPITQRTAVLIRGDLTDKTKSNVNTPQVIEGVKLIRNLSGKLVLVADKSPVKKLPLSPGVKVMIKNNKIQSISKNDEDNISQSAKIKHTSVCNDDKKDQQQEDLKLRKSNVNEDNLNKYDSDDLLETSEPLPAVIDLCKQHFLPETSTSSVSEIDIEYHKNSIFVE